MAENLKVVRQDIDMVLCKFSIVLLLLRVQRLVDDLNVDYERDDLLRKCAFHQTFHQYYFEEVTLYPN